MSERPARAQLVTARLLVEQFKAQIAEYKRMRPTERERTERGRDLAGRIDGLHEGLAKWEKRRTDLEIRAAAEEANGDL